MSQDHEKKSANNLQDAFQLHHILQKKTWHF